jgi:hypothetical protein
MTAKEKVKLLVDLLEEIRDRNYREPDVDAHEYCPDCGNSPYWNPPHEQGCLVPRIAEALRSVKESPRKRYDRIMIIKEESLTFGGGFLAHRLTYDHFPRAFPRRFDVLWNDGSTTRYIKRGVYDFSGFPAYEAKAGSVIGRNFPIMITRPPVKRVREQE